MSAETDANTKQSVLRQQAVRELRGLIASGAIAPGERIVEREVAERYGVSRGPVREALRELAHEGLVESTPYAGVCVTRLLPEEIDELVALRRQVEYFSIAGAALRADQDTCTKLRDVAQALGNAYQEGDLLRCVELDMEFHLGICEASQHKTLVVVMKALLPRLMVIWYPDLESGRLAPQELMEAHTTLVDAVEERNVELSLERIDEHIDSFYKLDEIKLRRMEREPGSRPTERRIVPTVSRRTLGDEPAPATESRRE